MLMRSLLARLDALTAPDDVQLLAVIVTGIIVTAAPPALVICWLVVVGVAWLNAVAHAAAARRRADADRERLDGGR